MSMKLFVAISAVLIMCMFMIDISMTNVAEDEGLTSATDIFDYEGSHIQKFDAGNFTLSEDTAGSLPSGGAGLSVEEDTGNVFTDTFSTYRDWILGIPGAKYVLGLVNALPNLLKFIFIGDYAVFAFALGYLWNILFVIFLIDWIRGGN